MGLFPDLDSPHSHRGRVHTHEEFKAMFHERILQYLPKPGYGSTFVGPITDATLRQLWMANGHGHYALMIYKTNTVYWITDVRFSQSDEIGVYCLFGRSIDNNREQIPVAYLDSNGGFSPSSICENTVVVTEGRQSVILLDLPLINIWLKNATLYVSNDEQTEIFRFKMQTDDGIELLLRNEKEYATVLTVTVKDTLSNREYLFRTQIEFLVHTQVTIGAVFESLIKPKFLKALPEYFTVESVKVTDFFGW
jgi:hypothetical protein